MIRALEIYRTTGRRKSDLDRASRTEDCPYRALVIGLRYSDRRILWDRIDRRVDAMMAAGLPEETRRLRAAGVFDLCPTAAQAIGYKELFPWLDGRARRARRRWKRLRQRPAGMPNARPHGSRRVPMSHG